MSARLKLTLSYAGFLMLAGVLLLAAVWLFLLRHVPDQALLKVPDSSTIHGVFPVRSNLLHSFAPRAVVVLIVLLLIGLVGGWFLAGRMLDPLVRITNATRLTAAGSLAHRIDLKGRNDEFGELAGSFDAMLARLEAHVTEQQRFAANASHELRTPLATMQTMLEVARHDPDVGSRALIDRLSATNRRAIELTEALLLLSRTSVRSFALEPVDVSLAAEEAIESLLPVAEGCGVTVDVDVVAAVVMASPSLLVQLATILVHNAIVHNRPRGGVVTVSVTLDEGSALLTVENTGELLDAEVVATLDEPFVRGTERINTNPVGVGLGLAIAKSIAEAHDGTLNLTARPGGGLVAMATLPCLA